MVIQSQFKPAWWLPNAHAQTIWPQLVRSTTKIKFQLERLELPDGDFCDLVWTENNSGPIIIVLHGLEGSINSHYAGNMLAALHHSGWRPVLMHFRGCSGIHNRNARSYHSGETGDLKFLIETLSTRHKSTQLAAVGFSLGGNVLLKYLGEEQDNTSLVAAISISVPFELSASADRLNIGFSKLYQRHLLKRLHKKSISKFKQRDNAPFSLANVSSWNTFHEFDNFVTAPLHGFKNSEEYYALCSSRQYLKSITIPTLMIQAKDDPFLPVDAIPENTDLSKNVTLELTQHGGHVGFVSGLFPWQANYWLEERVPEFLNRAISIKN